VSVGAVLVDLGVATLCVVGLASAVVAMKGWDPPCRHGIRARCEACEAWERRFGTRERL
jgi:hypothetical protein